MSDVIGVGDLQSRRARAAKRRWKGMPARHFVAQAQLDATRQAFVNNTQGYLRRVRSSTSNRMLRLILNTGALR
jgi:hypothetical protein